MARFPQLTLLFSVVSIQTNVHPTAQRRKMEPFSEFKCKAVVLVTKTEELEKRAKEKKEKDGFEIPDYALSDMKGL